jgi:hypothetical protein
MEGVQQVTNDPFKAMLETIARLERAKIYCEVAKYRQDAISLVAVVPGQRWEIDFLSDGMIDTEVFKSDGTIRDEKSIDDLIREFAD